jgi:hypothetical protein
VQSFAAFAERIVDDLVRTGSKTVERDREAVHTKLWHGLFLVCTENSDSHVVVMQSAEEWL